MEQLKNTSGEYKSLICILMCCFYLAMPVLTLFFQSESYEIGLTALNGQIAT